MAAFDASSTSSFYFYLPTIYDIRTRLPFSSFVAYVLTMLDVTIRKYTNLVKVIKLCLHKYCEFKQGYTNVI